MPDSTPFREKLRTWRYSKRIGQKQAADLLQIKVRTYMCYEQGAYEPSTNPSRQELEKRMAELI